MLIDFSGIGIRHSLWAFDVEIPGKVGSIALIRSVGAAESLLGHFISFGQTKTKGGDTVFTFLAFELLIFQFSFAILLIPRRVLFWDCDFDWAGGKSEPPAEKLPDMDTRSWLNV